MAVISFGSESAYLVRGVEVQRRENAVLDALGRTEEDRQFLDQFVAIFSAAGEGDASRCRDLIKQGYRDFEAKSYRRFKASRGGNLDGITPLKVAEINGHKEIVDIFNEVMGRKATKNLSPQEAVEEKKSSSTHNFQAGAAASSAVEEGSSSDEEFFTPSCSDDESSLGGIKEKGDLAPSTNAPSQDVVLHSLTSVDYERGQVVLEGVCCTIHPHDTFRMTSWKAGHLVVISKNPDPRVYPFYLTNQTVGHSVRFQLDSAQRGSTSTRFVLNSVNSEKKHLIINGSIWSVLPSDVTICQDWKENDSILVGLNVDRVLGPRRLIIIHVKSSTFVSGCDHAHEVDP